MKKSLKEKTSEKLPIAELFTSIQGESTYSGKICFFVRIAGCNLNCNWCDTKYASRARFFLSLDQIVSRALKSGAEITEITGGEPLLNPYVPQLCKKLISKKFNVLIETNGSLDISPLPEDVKIILDCKCPSSGEEDKMLFANFAKIKEKDEIKFVIAEKKDYQYAKNIIRKFNLFDKTQKIFFSPVLTEIKPSVLADWMIKDRSKATLALQLHKILWGKNAKGK